MKPHELWIKKAGNDLRTAERLIEGEDPILDSAIYHAQQCGEKALKAFLIFHDHPLEKMRTHDMELLIEKCCIYDENFKSIWEDAIYLDPYSTAFRYPDIVFEPEWNDVKTAIEMAQKILQFTTRAILSEEKN